MKIIGSITLAKGAKRDKEKEKRLEALRSSLRKINPLKAPKTAYNIAEDIRDTKLSMLSSGCYAPLDISHKEDN